MINSLPILRYLRTLPDRVDWDEVQRALAGDLPGVDTSQNAPEDPSERAPEDPAPVTPLERLEAAVTVSRDFRDTDVWDRTKKYNWRKYGWPADKSRGQSRGTRDWEQITTIVVHTAGSNGLHPDRWLGVPSHAAVANDATAVLQHRMQAYLWAAHAANRYSVSLEIAGDRVITPAQIPVARALVRYFFEERQRHVEGQMYIAPHMFSHRSRVNDCGPQIWNEVGVWAMDTFGLELGPVVGTGSGMPFGTTK